MPLMPPPPAFSDALLRLLLYIAAAPADIY